MVPGAAVALGKNGSESASIHLTLHFSAHRQKRYEPFTQLDSAKAEAIALQPLKPAVIGTALAI